VDLQQHRRTERSGTRAVHVEEMTVARAVGIANVADAIDACVSDPERQQNICRATPSATASPAVE